jgi:glycosyltransferase 2 family protein
MKRKHINIIIIAVSFFAMLIIVFFTQGMERMVSLLAGMNYFWLAVAFGCMVMYWFLDAVIIHSITRNLFKEQRFADSVKVTMISKFFYSITPLASGGQPALIYVMARDGIKPGYAVSIAVIKSAIYQIMIVVYSVCVIAFRSQFFISKIHGFFYVYLVGLCLNLCLVSVWILIIYKRAAANKVVLFIFNILTRFKIFRKLVHYEKKFESEQVIYDEGTRILKNNVRMIISSSILQAIGLTLFFSIPFFIYLSMETAIKVNIGDMVATQSMISMIASYIPTPGSTGAAEGTGYIFFSLFFKSSLIIPIILIWRLITFYSTVVVGGLVTLLTRTKPAIQL